MLGSWCSQVPRRTVGGSVFTAGNRVLLAACLCAGFVPLAQLRTVVKASLSVDSLAFESNSGVSACRHWTSLVDLFQRCPLHF